MACSAGAGNTGDGDSGDGDSGDGDGDINPGDGDGDIQVPGDGDGDGDTGMGGADMTDCDSTLELVIRDFNSTHPDMERTHPGQNEMFCGVVQPDLFVGSEGTRTPLFFDPSGTGKRDIQNGIITCQDWVFMYNMNVPPGYPDNLAQFAEFDGEASFNQWYTDSDVSETIEYTITLKPLPGNENVYYYDSAEEQSGGFFPIDGAGLNEVTSGHNFHFTTEAHVRFIYQGGEKFTFSGDDDMWIFVNDKLALDLGGLHGPLSATIDFDAQATALGITPGNTYNMDIFHAERRTSASNYRVETSIGCFETVDVPRVVVK